MLAYVFGGRWHQLVDNFAEQTDVSPGIAANAGHQFGQSVLML
jgi:hypothetical protein